MGILFRPLVDMPVCFFVLVNVTPASSHLLSAKLSLTAIRYSKGYFVQDNADSQSLRLFAKSPKPQLVTPASIIN